jgi:tetratricopeptide (TPR) repeat protein
VPVSLAVVFAVSVFAADVITPPVPIGILQEGKLRQPKHPIPFPSEKHEWTRVRSARFDVLSSASSQRTRQIVADLETLADALATASPRLVRVPVVTKVFIFGHRKESQPYFDVLFSTERSRATGAYVRHRAGGTMFVDASRGRHVERTATHELVHDLLRRGRVPPLWIEEGLAEYFSNAEILDGKVRAGQAIREHVMRLHQRRAFPLARLFGVRRESAEATTALFYAQSWAAVHWLMSTDREAFFDFVADLERGVATADALQQHFGKTIAEMERAIRWRGQGNHQITIDAPQVPVPASSTVDRATLLYELGRFLTFVSGAGKDRERHFLEALRVNPRHAKTLAALGRFEEAVAADPEDADVHLTYAEALVGTALGPFAGVFEPAEADATNFPKARALATRALALGADESAAQAVIGTSYLVEADVRPGIAPLERSRTLVPRRDDVALNLLAMYLAVGDREKADALYRNGLANSRNRQTAFAARNVLLVAETKRANALTAEGRLDEAAALVRSLAGQTPDARGRADLESQAADLEAIGTVNRHITAYNEAIALANAGDTKAAIASLDALLEVATDPQVVADATKLRNELTARAAPRR